MKSGITLAVILLSVCNSFGQLSKGNLLVGGTINFDYSKDTYTIPSIPDPIQTDQLTFRFDPQISYFFTNYLSVGLSIPLRVSRGESEFNTTNFREFSIGPKIRYYFPFGRFAVFPELNYKVGTSRSTSDPMDNNFETVTINGNTQTISGGAGVTYFVSKNVGLEGIVSYENFRNNVDSDTISDIESNTLMLFFGVQVYLPTRSSN